MGGGRKSKPAGNTNKVSLLYFNIKINFFLEIIIFLQSIFITDYNDVSRLKHTGIKV